MGKRLTKKQKRDQLDLRGLILPDFSKEIIEEEKAKLEADLKRYEEQYGDDAILYLIRDENAK